MTPATWNMHVSRNLLLPAVYAKGRVFTLKMWNVVSNWRDNWLKGQLKKRKNMYPNLFFESYWRGMKRIRKEKKCLFFTFLRYETKQSLQSLSINALFNFIPPINLELFIKQMMSNISSMWGMAIIIFPCLFLRNGPKLLNDFHISVASLVCGRLPN